MRSTIYLCVLCFLISLTTSIYGQGTLAINYTNTSDYHQGFLISYEDLLYENIFSTYSLGVSESHFFKWENILNVDIGYRFHFNNYQPDVRLGFGYLFGNYKTYTLDSNRETRDSDEIDTHLTTYLKLRWLNWNFPKSYQLPIRLTASIGVQYQYSEYGFYNSKVDNYWNIMFETGFGYRFY